MLMIGVGWDEGMMTMKLGERANLHMSPDYGYGAGGFPAWVGLTRRSLVSAHRPRAFLHNSDKPTRELSCSFTVGIQFV